MIHPHLPQDARQELQSRDWQGRSGEARLGNPGRFPAKVGGVWYQGKMVWYPPTFLEISLAWYHLIKFLGNRSQVWEKWDHLSQEWHQLMISDVSALPRRNRSRPFGEVYPHEMVSYITYIHTYLHTYIHTRTYTCIILTILGFEQRVYTAMVKWPYVFPLHPRLHGYSTPKIRHYWHFWFWTIPILIHVWKQIWPTYSLYINYIECM